MSLIQVVPASALSVQGIGVVKTDRTFVTKMAEKLSCKSALKQVVLSRAVGHVGFHLLVIRWLH